MALICTLLALFCVGALRARFHTPGPPPEIDATGREVVIVGGCVVEPPANGHEDHIGGVPALFADFRPREIWTGATPDSPLWRAVYDKPAQTGAKIVSMQAGRSFGLGGAEVEVLGAGRRVHPIGRAEEQRFAGDAAVVRTAQFSAER